ncbi:unnamed protein product [Citrullus colocynthis]|uniref:Uncharacterized protein n=1 Tax=Citrullus colocynthis TaxID=252529 RepID=A0ABP0Z744_9ROSI
MTCEIRKDCGSLGSRGFPPGEVEIQRWTSNRNGRAKINGIKVESLLESGGTWAQNFRQGIRGFSAWKHSRDDGIGMGFWECFSLFATWGLWENENVMMARGVERR